MSLPDQQIPAFRAAVLAARGRNEVIEAVRNVYLALQDQIELRRPICRTSGRCCRFEEFGHRLFVTTMELATFFSELNPTPELAASSSGCPFQVDGLCSVHGIRPFGCRIFFCDETSEQWQRRQYEFFHAELKRLHERLAVPYFYVEWRAALQALASPMLPYRIEQ